jgi:hypothetical protein
MGTAKKEYLLNLFIKILYNRQEINYTIQENAKVIRTAYSIDDSDFKNILEKYNSEEYCKRLSFIIDKTFSEEELEECIKFFQSIPGKKMINNNHINSFQKIGKGLLLDIEKEFILKKNK